MFTIIPLNQMLKFPTALFAGLTGATAAMLITSAANAAPRPSSYVNPHRGVVQAVQDAGFRTFTDADACKEDPRLMGFVAPAAKAFVICFDNADSDTQIYTTIRHEALHVAQVCNGGPLLPKRSDEFIARAQDEGWHILGYPTNQWAVEAEARVLANEFTAQEVTNIVNLACN